jgi:beta-glucosidase-like glycosyl hydrolase
MNDLTYWTTKLKEAERELDAATRRSDVNAAAKRVMRVKAELKAVKAEKGPSGPTRPRDQNGSSLSSGLSSIHHRTTSPTSAI